MKTKTKLVEGFDSRLLIGYLSPLVFLTSASIYNDLLHVIYILAISAYALYSWYKLSCERYNKMYIHTKAKRLLIMLPVLIILSVLAHLVDSIWTVPGYILPCIMGYCTYAYVINKKS